MRSIFKKTTLFFCTIFLCQCLLAQTPDTTKPKKAGLDLIEEIQRDIEIQNRKNGKQPTNTPGNPSNINYPDERQAAPPRPPKPPKEPLKLHHYEVQMEVGAFFNQIFTLFGLVDTGAAYKPSNYFLAYKFKPKKTDKSGAFRLGLGGNYRKTKETRGGFADNVQVINSSYGGRLGYEFQKRLERAWVWSIGADVLTMQRTTKIISDSGIDQVTNLTKGWESGVALMMGLRWDFGERMTVGTEVNLRFTSFKGLEENRFTANPQFDKILKNIDDNSTEFIGPANVYLSIRF